jgi:DNA-binding winged helix-turn-helix (wHTH) protein
MSLDLTFKVDQNNLRLVKPSGGLIYEFEGFRLDGEHLMLYEGEHEVPLTPKQVETLLALVEQHGEIISKHALMERVWGQTSVEESNLIQNIHYLRRALGETSDGGQMIETLRRRGYRFNGKLSEPRRKPIARVLEPKSAGSGKTELVPPLVGPARLQSADAGPVAEKARSEVYGSEMPKISKRRAGVNRGFKILLLGLVVGFVFMISLQTLLIAHGLLFQFDNNVNAGGADSTRTMVADLITMLTVPVGFGWFFGIGLFLFGLFRMAYALLEKEKWTIRSLVIERIIAGIICLLLLSVAVPNLLQAYQRSSRLNQAKKGEAERSVTILPVKPPAAPGE